MNYIDLLVVPQNTDIGLKIAGISYEDIILDNENLSKDEIINKIKPVSKLDLRDMINLSMFISKLIGYDALVSNFHETMKRYLNIDTRPTINDIEDIIVDKNGIILNSKEILSQKDTQYSEWFSFKFVDNTIVAIVSDAFLNALVQTQVGVSRIFFNNLIVLLFKRYGDDIVKYDLYKQFNILTNKL